MNKPGALRMNPQERFELCETELTTGSLVEIRINKQWLLGVIEYWKEACYWLSKEDDIAVILRSGIEARIPVRP